MKKAILPFLLSLVLLSACSSNPEEPTKYTDVTSGSIYGALSDFSISPDQVKEGDELTFYATPVKDFAIREITNNGIACEQISTTDPTTGKAQFKTTIVKGNNKLAGSYNVNSTKDYVKDFKMNISDEVFNAVLHQTATGDINAIDFRRSGIEKMNAPCRYKDGVKVKNRIGTSDVFVNYVDGDTTHIETANLNYTVKIRYLGIDTPESTSEIEKWGLSASYYNKYIYSENTDTNYEKYLDEVSLEYAKDHAGMTYVILQSEACAVHAEEYTLEELNDPTCNKYAAEVDGYGRSLAYVWYYSGDKAIDDITKDDFRCLNLEMVYMGFSFSAGNMQDMGEHYFRAFDKSNLTAAAKRIHLQSNEEDPNYYDFEDTDNCPVRDLSLATLYNSCTKTDRDIKYLCDSPFIDKKTLYAVEGYVSRKVGQAFFIQNKPSYTADDILNGNVYGLYVYTLRETPIDTGYHVRVVGALSDYSGTIQMQGISYHDLNQDPIRDTKILTKPGTSIPDIDNEIVPIPVTGRQFNDLKYPQVLVKITDNVYPYEFQSKHAGSYDSINEGGSEEINKYNTAYPFYNTSNSPIVFCSFGDHDNAEEVNLANRDGGNKGMGCRLCNDVIRFNIDDNVLLQFGAERCYSYRFLVGGSYLYNSHGAEYANYDESNPYKNETAEKSFNRKVITRCIVISKGYESGGGNRKMTALIAKASDISMLEL